MCALIVLAGQAQVHLSARADEAARAAAKGALHGRYGLRDGDHAVVIAVGGE